MLEVSELWLLTTELWLLDGFITRQCSGHNVTRQVMLLKSRSKTVILDLEL